MTKNKNVQMTKTLAFAEAVPHKSYVRCFGHSIFGFVSDFDIRYSDFS